MPVIKHAIMAISALGLTGLASADEVWTSNGREIVYETDLPNGMAVWSFDGAKLFIQGLAGQYEDRDTYEGIFVNDGDYQACDFAIANPQTGETTYNWGRIRVIFIDPEVPSRWVAMGADSFDDPVEDPIVAMPVTGE